MAIKENKNTKKPSKLKGAKNALQFASDKFRSSKSGGDTTLSALKAGIKEYSEKGKAASIVETGRVGGVGDFFKGAGFENLGEILGSLFDKSATKEQIEEAKKSLGITKEEPKPENKKEAKEKVPEKSYTLKQSEQILKKINALGKIILGINQKLDYISERVSPKIIDAKEEGGKSINVIQYDPLAPAGEQFRGISDSGKLSVKKIPKEYMKSAVMQASLLGKGAPEKSKVNKFVDPKEKDFTEEFKKEDPILLLRDDMNMNFKKIFDLLEEQKDACSGGEGGDMFGDIVGRRRGRGGRKRNPPKPKSTPKNPTPKVSPTATATTRTVATTAARTATTTAATAATTAATTTAATTAATGTATGAAAKKWQLFLKYMKRKAPKLYARVGVRLAAAAGMATVPLAGWIGAVITLGLSLSLAWEVFTLWQEFSAISDIESALEESDKIEGLGDEEQDQITAYLKERTLIGNFMEDPDRLTLITDGDKNVGFSYYPGPMVPFEGKENEFEKITKKADGDVDKVESQYKNKPFKLPPSDKKETEQTETTKPKEESGMFSTAVSAVKSFFGFSGDSGGGASAEEIPKAKGSTDVLSGGSVSIPSSEEDIKKMIIGHEGVRYRPYKDSRGLWTVGVGHLIGDGTSLPPAWDRQFTESEVLGLFEKDYEEHRKAAEGIPGFNKMNIAGKAALTDLTFNMGPYWIKKWPNTAKKLEAGDFEGVAGDLEQSKWYTQVGNRAPKIVGLMRMAGDDSIAMSEKRGGVIPSQSGSESNAGMVIPSQSGSESNAGMVIPSQSGSESNKGMVIPSQTAAVAPVQSTSGAEIDNGSKALDAAKTESAAPVIVNNTTVQQGQSSMPPPAGGQLPSAKPRSAEGSFGRAIAKDFSHPTAFTTMGTI